MAPSVIKAMATDEKLREIWEKSYQWVSGHFA
jgi:hypothetical protein